MASENHGDDGAGGLDPEVGALLARLRERGEPTMFAGTDTAEGLAAARGRYAALMAETARAVDAAPELVEDAPVPLRVHRPAGRESGALVVHVHGGGWVLGGGAVYDPVAQRLADDTRAVVVAVDHRLAPEHPFPTPYDDVLAAVDWVVAHADRWDADPARLGLAGDSAGANLVAGAALARRDAGTPAAATLLVYPPPDFEGRYPSVRENGAGFFLGADDVVACAGSTWPARSPKGDPRLSPAAGRRSPGWGPRSSPPPGSTRCATPARRSRRRSRRRGSTSGCGSTPRSCTGSSASPGFLRRATRPWRP